MILLLCALYCEAKPIIKRLNLKRNNDNRYIEEYVDEENIIHLIITGVGEVEAASVTSAALMKYFLEDEENAVHLVNIGTCAGNSKLEDKIFAINKITDESTSRDYYPDMLYRLGIKEKAIVTYSKPVKYVDNDSLCDMEASGIFVAGNRFVAPDRMTFIKIISDSGVESTISPKVLTLAIEEQLDKIINAINVIKASLESEGKTKICNELLDEACLKLCCTTSMRNELNQLFKYALLINLDIKKIVDDFPYVDNKRQGKEIMDGFKNDLI